jgi:hypothetical protein
MVCTSGGGWQQSPTEEAAAQKHLFYFREADFTLIRRWKPDTCVQRL